jgi:hypothetical protein
MRNLQLRETAQDQGAGLKHSSRPSSVGKLSQELLESFFSRLVRGLDGFIKDR